MAATYKLDKAKIQYQQNKTGKCNADATKILAARPPSVTEQEERSCDFENVNTPHFEM